MRELIWKKVGLEWDKARKLEIVKKLGRTEEGTYGRNQEWNMKEPRK